MRIYGIKDKLKQKIVYIGKTKNDKDYLPHGKHILKLFKNNPERYKYVILENIDNNTILDEREVYYIEMYKTFHQNDCFNFTKGGTGGFTLGKYSDEERRKIKSRELETKKLNPVIMKDAAAKGRQTFLKKTIEEQMLIKENRIKKSIIAKKIKKEKMTSEELKERSKNNSIRVKNIHLNRTEEFKKNINDKISKTLSKDKITLQKKETGENLSLTFTQWKKLYKVDVFHLKQNLQKSSHGWALPCEDSL
jgi:hypothetical protein